MVHTLPHPFFILAPMDDVTDTVFRQIVADCAAPDLFFTEFVNVDGLQSPGRSKLLKKLRFIEGEQSLIVQVWGLNPDNFYRTARELVDGTFVRELGLPEGVTIAGIDINMGCPDKTVVKNGACSALINDRELALDIIHAVQEGADGIVPVSVKTRLGFNTIDLSWHELLLNQKLNMLTIHGRTRKEMSKVPAHWEEIGRIRELRDQLAPATSIVGNGDVANRLHGLQLAEQYKLDGIMIGRGIFHDPFAFAEDSPWDTFSAEQRIELYRKQVELFKATWQQGERPVHTLNKSCKIYIQGFDGAKELRERLMTAHTADELLTILDHAYSAA
ncbi:MAG TPA: tRNA-dihydrouridine synthase [Candidatus Saccharimonadales bacterium]|nr:tRNA-dihydrouridine synthase [Candidatus Saccharimonadales bacterium]